MKKYKAVEYSAKIAEVEVDRETGGSVWIRGLRSAKNSSYCSYFDTWEQAHAYILLAAESELNSLRLQLERAKGKVGNIKGMKKPA